MSEASTLLETGHDGGHGNAGGKKPLMAHGSILNTQITNGKIAMWLFLGSEVMFFTGLIGAYVVLRFKQDNWADPLDPQFPLNIGLTAFNTFLLICSSVTLVYALQNIQLGKRWAGNMGLLWTTIFGATFVGIQAYEYYELWIQTDPVKEIRTFASKETDPTTRENLFIVGDEMEEDFEAAYATFKGPKGGFFSAAGEMWAGTHVPPNEIYPSNKKLLKLFHAKEGRPVEQQAALDKFVAYVGDHDKFHWHNATRPATDIFASCFYAMTSFHGFHVFIGVVSMLVLTIMGFLGKFGPDNYGVVELTGLYWHFVDLVWIVLFAIVYLM